MLKVRGWRQEMWGVPSVKQMRSPHRCQNSLQRTRSGGKITPSWAFYLARKNINRVDMWKLFWEFVGKHWYLNSMAFLILSFFDVDFGVWIARVPLSFHSGQSFVVLESVHFTLALWSHFTSKLLVQWDTVSCHWTCWTCYCSPNLRWGNSEFHLGWNDAILPSLGSLWIPIIWRNSPLPFFFPVVSPRPIGMTFFFHVWLVYHSSSVKVLLSKFVWLPPFLCTVRYCWWTKSCTTKDDDYPIIYRVLTIPGGAGFCPSTVGWQNNGLEAEAVSPTLS